MSIDGQRFNEGESSLLKRVAAPIHGGHTKNGLMKHPLMTALDTKTLNQDEIKKLCHVRYNAASEFVPLLERALELARANGAMPDLVQA
jgi:hypothetical protein